MSLGMAFCLIPPPLKVAILREYSSHMFSLEKSCVFIPQDQATESPTLVSGQLCISLRQNICIKSVKVRLRGILTM
jgi:hypothetical protein